MAATTLRIQPKESDATLVQVATTKYVTITNPQEIMATIDLTAGLSGYELPEGAYNGGATAHYDASTLKAALAGFCLSSRHYNLLFSLGSSFDYFTGIIGPDAKAVVANGCAWVGKFKATRVSQLVGNSFAYPLFNELLEPLRIAYKSPTLFSCTHAQPDDAYGEDGVTSAAGGGRSLEAFLRSHLISATSTAFLSLVGAVRLAFLQACISSVSIEENVITVSWQPNAIVFFANLASHAVGSALRDQLIPDIVDSFIKFADDTGKTTSLGEFTLQHISPSSVYAMYQQGDEFTYNFPDGTPATLVRSELESTASQSFSGDYNTVPDEEKPIISLYGSGNLPVVALPEYTRKAIAEHCPQLENSVGCLAHAEQLGLLTQIDGAEHAVTGYYSQPDAKKRKRTWKMRDVASHASGNKVADEQIKCAIAKVADSIKGLGYSTRQAWNLLYASLQEYLQTIHDNEYYTTIDDLKYLIIRSFPSLEPTESPQVEIGQDGLFIPDQLDYWREALRFDLFDGSTPIFVPFTDVTNLLVGKLPDLVGDPSGFSSYSAFKRAQLWYTPSAYRDLMEIEQDHCVDAYLARATSGSTPGEESKKKSLWWLLLLLIIPVVALTVGIAADHDNNNTVN